MADRVCLYALVAGSVRPVRVAGLAGERVRVVKLAGVEAVIGRVSRMPKPTAAAIRRYDAIERQLMESYTSVLPARFGTCAATLDELALTVRDRHVGIRRNLRLVHRRAQMTLRLFTRSAVQTGSEYGDGATQGTRYLQRRMAEMQIPGAEPIRMAVAKWVRAERVERHPAGPSTSLRASQLAGSLYHLVPRSAIPAYRRAVERAAADADLTTIVSGPWPPYAFTG